MTQLTQMSLWMAELMDVLAGVSPAMKMAWLVWMVVGLGLLLWMRAAPALSQPVVAAAPAAGPTARSISLGRIPWETVDPPPPSVAIASVAEPMGESPDRPAKKPRRSRKGDAASKEDSRM